MAPETSADVRERLAQIGRRGYVENVQRVTGERTQRERDTDRLESRLRDLEREERRVERARRGF